VVRIKQGPQESTKDKVVRTKQVTKSGRVFELGERTALFGEAAIKLANGLSRTPVTTPLISQLVRSSTSVGANYMEAGAAQSGKDFDNKIGICKKEARETMHWLRMMAVADDSVRSECRTMWQEAHELTMIFSAILKKRHAGVET
jgi:four helix bundle protein